MGGKRRIQRKFRRAIARLALYTIPGKETYAEGKYQLTRKRKAQA